MIDKDLLVQLMSTFEADNSALDIQEALHETHRGDNPFLMGSVFDAELLRSVEAFTSQTVQDTASWLPEGSQDLPGATAIAGFLQGCFIGYEYAKRTSDA